MPVSQRNLSNELPEEPQMTKNTSMQMFHDDQGSAVTGERRPCIALMGEFSAGKTTLINFLVGADALPTQVTATQVPPVWLSYGKDDDPFFVDSDNRSYPMDLSGLQTLDVGNVRYAKVFVDSEFLKQVDLIDTPGISDPNIPEFHRDTAIKNADAIIWCTHATQAWRESENSAWSTVPEDLRAKSILVATRADKLDDHNRERVRKRLQREASDLFDTIILFSATEAMEARNEVNPSGLWEHSGGAKLLAKLQQIAGGGTSDATGGAPQEGAESVPDDAPKIRPARVTNRPGRGRLRISAEDAKSMRDELLSASNGFHAPDDTVEPAATTELPSIELSASESADDVPDNIFGLPHQEESEEISVVSEILSERIEDTEEISFEDSLGGRIPGGDEACGPECEAHAHGFGVIAHDDDPIADEMDARQPEIGADDQNTLAALKEILNDEVSEPEDSAEDAALQGEEPQQEGALTPLELWRHVQREYSIQTVSDVVGAISVLIEVLQENDMCFAQGNGCCTELGPNQAATR